MPACQSYMIQVGFLVCEHLPARSPSRTTNSPLSNGKPSVCSLCGILAILSWYKPPRPALNIQSELYTVYKFLPNHVSQKKIKIKMIIPWRVIPASSSPHSRDRRGDSLRHYISTGLPNNAYLLNYTPEVPLAVSPRAVPYGMNRLIRALFAKLRRKRREEVVCPSARTGSQGAQQDKGEGGGGGQNMHSLYLA